jgi:hypothetical protein
MGLDMSDLNDLDRLYKFVALFETSKKKTRHLKIVNIKELQVQKQMVQWY